MAAHKDWVRAEVSVGGTGNLTVTNVADWPAFNDSATLNEVFSYAILNEEFAPIELGEGKRTGSNTFQRDTIIATFTGALDITTPAPADIPAGSKLVSILSGSVLDAIKALAESAVQPSAIANMAEMTDIANMLETADIGVTVQGYDVDTAKLDVAQAYTARQRFVQTTCLFTTLTYAASLQPNLAAGQAHVVTATGNATLNQPLNEDSTNFQSFQLEFIQDGTGGRTLGFNTTFYEAGIASFPVVTATANRKTVLLFNRQSNGKYLVIAVNDVRST